jgi:hypothetical protein
MIDKEIVDELAAALIPVSGAVDDPKIPLSTNENVHSLLTKCNGGYSKDRYFHFFGSCGVDAHSIDQWNSAELWKTYYDDLVVDYSFFAEDIFGNQFGHKLDDSSEEVFLFWVDDGRLESFASDFEEFLDYTIFGTEVFKEMRQLNEQFSSDAHHGVPLFHHLTYAKPLLLGGKSDDADNLELAPAVDHLRFSGQIVVQCRALPVGAKVTDVIIEKDSQTITLVSE